MHFKKCLNTIIIVLLSATLLAGCNSDDEADDEAGSIPNGQPIYHSPESLEQFLQTTYNNYPNITYLEPVGTSFEGRTIWALVISDIPTEFEPEPKIRIVGAIHGDENVTTEIIVRMIEFITTNYSSDENIQDLVNNRYIVLIPMMNPDGVFYNTRYNSNEVDLNRNFNVEWRPSIQHGESPFSELESISLRDYSDYIGFHLSISYHSGAVIVNIPFDYASEHQGGEIPEEYDLVNHLARVYSTSGTFLENEHLLDTQYIEDGIINGGDWYIVNGSLQDWSYIQTGCIDLTIEVSEIKQPETTQEIDAIFEMNRLSLTSYIDSAGIGIYGRVIDSVNSAPLKAKITIDSGDIVTSSDDYGYYHRVLLPGNYIITFLADGYEEYSEEITISDDIPVLEKNIILQKSDL